MNNRKQFKIKRIYEPYSKNDGYRVLVDRLWPRGVSKSDAQIDFWAKDISPTAELRKWFGHEPSRFNEFRARYLQELESNQESVRKVIDGSENEVITFLYAARDTANNHAIVLQAFCQTLV